jgi:hypothetical protein
VSGVKGNIFARGDWTTQITLIRFKKLDFARNANGADLRYSRVGRVVTRRFISGALDERRITLTLLTKGKQQS